MRWLPMISGQASHPRSVGCFVFQVFCSAFHLFGGGTMEHHRGPRNSAIRTPQNPVIVMVLRFRVLACLVLPCVSCVSCVTYAAPLCKYDFPPLTITLNELHQNSLTYGGRGGRVLPPVAVQQCNPSPLFYICSMPQNFSGIFFCSWFVLRLKIWWAGEGNGNI